MRKIADDLYQLDVHPGNLVNMYLAGDTLIDAGMPFSAGRIYKELRGHEVRTHALTHTHPDHMGASHAVCEALKLEFICGENDAPSAETGDMRRVAPDPDHWWLGWQHRVMPIAGHPVERALREGDEVAGFTVIDAPGHTPGQVSYWRERDRVLILGDVAMNMNMITFTSGLHWAVRRFTFNPAQNRASARKLAELKPRIVCFGHGPVLKDGVRFTEFAGAD
jgi:glyoxylase-like metal-dependent hydrolase (beta-lactamase superfamily II)